MTAHILYSDHLFDAYLLSDEEEGVNRVTQSLTTPPLEGIEIDQI